MTPQQRATNAATYRKLAATCDKNARELARKTMQELDKSAYWLAQAKEMEEGRKKPITGNRAG